MDNSQSLNATIPLPREGQGGGVVGFFCEGTTRMPDIDQERTARWICDVAASYGKRVGTVNYIFVDDERILEVNRQFLGHDYYTDIITFDYTQGRIISGDLYISLDTVRSNVEKLLSGEWRVESGERNVLDSQEAKQSSLHHPLSTLHQENKSSLHHPLSTLHQERAELHRVVIHGILHLCGLNDKGPGEREQMEAAEDRALASQLIIDCL